MSTGTLILVIGMALIFGVILGGVVMFVFTKQEKKRRIIENVGPDLPRVLINAHIQSYVMNERKDIVMYLNIGNDLHDIHVIVPEMVPRRFPLGTDVELVMQPKGK